jgi:hypothetical protein
MTWFAALADLGSVYARRDEALNTLKWARRSLESAQRSIARPLEEIDSCAASSTTNHQS